MFYIIASLLAPAPPLPRPHHRGPQGHHLPPQPPPVLPAPDEHDLVDIPESNITAWFDEALFYDEAYMIYDTGLKNSAEVYFFLPYRWMGLYHPLVESPGSLYGAIFPDAIMYYWI